MDPLPEAERWTVAIDADTTPLQRELVNATRFGRQFSTALVSAFDGLVVKGRGFGDVLSGLAASLSRMTLAAALKPLEQGFGQLLGGLLTGGSAVTGFAKGGVVSQGLPVPFAAGGVIRSPIAFPLAGGRMGVAGERGAEAILPLARGPDGRLGVAQSGGGGGIVINIETADAESFRRSQTQIAGVIARAAMLGQRNL